MRGREDGTALILPLDDTRPFILLQYRHKFAIWWPKYAVSTYRKPMGSHLLYSVSGSPTATKIASPACASSSPFCIARKPKRDEMSLSCVKLVLGCRICPYGEPGICMPNTLIEMVTEPTDTFQSSGLPCITHD